MRTTLLLRQKVVGETCIKDLREVRETFLYRRRTLPFMVETKPFVLEAEIAINVPLDIFRNKDRLEGVREGIKKALTRGLYEQGVDFEIKQIRLKADADNPV